MGDTGDIRAQSFREIFSRRWSVGRIASVPARRHSDSQDFHGLPLVGLALEIGSLIAGPAEPADQDIDGANFRMLVKPRPRFEIRRVKTQEPTLRSGTVIPFCRSSAFAP
jgi:hypothetical protein